MISLRLDQVKAQARFRPKGYLDDLFSIGVVKADAIVFTQEQYDSLVFKYRTQQSKPTAQPKQPFPLAPNGVGSILKSLLRKIGITATPNCSCNRRAAEMDKLGPQWCRDNIDAIVGWLKEEAVKRNLPFVEFAAKKLVQLAICKYEKIQNNINRSAN